MRTLLVGALGLVVTLPLAVAAPNKEKEAKEEAKKFDGDWQITSWRQYGNDLSPEQAETGQFSIRGDKYTFEITGNAEEGTIKIDPTAKTPTFDLDITEGSDKGKKQPGIYKMEGDTVTLCLAAPGGTDRPTEFTSTEENRQILCVMKRKKKE